ncbi:hypothetical protein GGR57DRAFT_511697 [Xylariaceae sp. FL1272]|nr:hypothetical protein GGR57DRAFT_511697 [Xylariaceae sp. FL1272]
MYKPRQKLREAKYGPLFAERITTARKLLDSINTSAFVGMDIEVEPGCQVNGWRQVGLAYLSTMSHGDESSYSLPEFVSRKGISATTLDVPPGKDCTLATTTRQKFRYGSTYKSSNLEEDLHTVLQGYKSRAMAEGKHELILVLFEWQAEWKLLKRFPSLQQYFTKWVDIRNIAHEMAPTGDTLGLSTVLEFFGYDHKHIQGKRNRKVRDVKHNAGNDAVHTLVVLECLFVPSKLEKFRRCQICAYIGRDSYGQLRIPSSPYTALIEAVDGKLLPSAIGNPYKVAGHYFDEYAPVRTYTWPPQYRRHGWTVLRHPKATQAWISFKDLDSLNRFVEHNQQVTIDGRAMMITSLYEANLKIIEAEREKRARIIDQCKREGEVKRQERAHAKKNGVHMTDIFADLSDIF